MRSRLASAVLALSVLLGLVACERRDVQPQTVSSAVAGAGAAAQEISRGEYLARVGNCAHCHTARGGAAYAGGRAIETPFGSVYSSNLTSDPSTGIGAWTAQDFWVAMHHGRSRDGRWLLPAFPYTDFTRVSRADSDALFAWLATLSPVPQRNREHALRWPYSSQWALGAWRALYFRVASFQPDASRSIEWNRGAYLVQGLGHCSACHAARNALGASNGASALAGGLIPMLNWYAPSLAISDEGGVQGWDLPDIVQLLQTGASIRGWATGPMAEVVQHSTQFMSAADLNAMAHYLKELDQAPTAKPAVADSDQTGGAVFAPGAKLYEQHCSQCHGEDGRGVPQAYPALAGNRAVTMDSPVNLVQIVMQGGFSAATQAKPRPFGMPPYALNLSDQEIAEVLSYIRNAWGNRASAVTPQDVDPLRSHASR